MRLRSDCSVMELRGKYLLMGPNLSLEVNDGFKALWDVAAALGEFSAESLAGKIAAVFDISEKDALAEAEKAISLWEKHSLTRR